MLRAGVEDVGGIHGGVGAHAHVQRCTLAEGESALLVVNLVRRNTEVEQDAAEGGSRQFGEVVDVGEVRLHGTEGARGTVLGQRFRGGADGCWILVQADDARTALEEGECVTASTERAIQYVPSVAEQLGDLAGENGRVKGWNGG